MDNIGRLAGSNGCLVIDTTGAITGISFDFIVAQEDTVISVCTGTDAGGNAFDFKTSYNCDTLKSGAVITAKAGYKITAITLTSGSVICY
jgi:hypothetical protein